jgi:hypothetical protein
MNGTPSDAQVSKLTGDIELKLQRLDAHGPAMRKRGR